MIRKILWFSWPVVASTLVFLVLRQGPSPGGGRADQRVEELAGEVAQLQHGVSRMSGSLGSAAGASVLAAARPELAGAATAGTGQASGAAESPNLAATLAAQQEQEKRYYANLDQQIRGQASTGAAAAVQMRKNVEALRALAARPGQGATVEGFDCTDTLCRVAVKVDGRRDSARMAAV